jgi:hypothetical protein
MANRNPRKTPAYDVAEYLADREGLVGQPKHRFLRLLHGYGSFRQVSRPKRLLTLILVSLILTVAGFILDCQSGWRSSLVWLYSLLLSVGPVWQLHREESRLCHPDPESDWQAYRQFLRPVVLSDHPGLLDQNSKNLRSESEQSLFHMVPMFRNLMLERGPDFWWSIVFGLWCGMSVLLIIHLAIASTSWMLSLILPLVGMVVGPVIWTVWRRIIYLMAKSDTRLSSS